MRTMRVALAAAVIASLAACAPSPSASAGDVLVPLDPVPYVLEVPESLGARLSTRARPWSEPSATTVWGTLRELGVAEVTLLWNAFPWHPHKPGNLQSNRTPSPPAG